MKKILIIVFIILLLTGCGKNNKYEENQKISVNNDKKIQNKLIIQNNLYSKTTKITFHDPKDIKKFKKELEKVNNEIKLNTGSIKIEQIILKARLLDYLGKTGEALKLYVNNFENNMNDRSLVYNHNMARLYNKLGAYKQALIRYGFLIEYFNRPDYYKDMSKIFEKMGNKEKAEKAMRGYNKAMGKKQKGNIEIKNINIGSGGVLELK